MPRAKTTGGAYADKGRRSAIPAGAAGEAVRGAGVEVLLGESTQAIGAELALLRLAIYDEGWVRIVSHEMGHNIYFKFKFSKGRYAGGYVFYRCDDLDVTSALFGLLAKVEAVYAGTLRPTPDHYGGE